MGSSILKSSSLYAIGTIARAASSIIMLPIYTRYLTPDIYGTAELLNLVLDLTILLLGARITTGMFKFYSDVRTPTEKNSVLSTCLWLGLAVNMLAICILWLAAPSISTLLSDLETHKALQWFAFTLAFGTLSEIGLGYFRVNDEAGKYLSFSLLKLTLQVSASIYFIVYLELGLWGIIYSALFSGGLQTVLLLGFVLPKIGLKFELNLAKNLINYSLPIIYGSIAMYYMTFGDRFFIQYFKDTSEVGIYALGYKFGFLLTSLIWAPFMSYWGAKQFDHAKSPDGKKEFSKIFYTANYILWAAATGMALFATPTIYLMADNTYFRATDIAPFIILAYCFQCWTEFHRFGILESGNTKYLNYYTWLSAFIISILYIVLIPIWGGVGAAIATALVMFIRFLLVYKKSQQYFPVHCDWKKISLLLTLSITALAVKRSVSIDNYHGFIDSTVIFFFVIVMSIVFKCLPNEITRLALSYRKNRAT